MLKTKSKVSLNLKSNLIIKRVNHCRSSTNLLSKLRMKSRRRKTDLPLKLKSCAHSEPATLKLKRYSMKKRSHMTKSALISIWKESVLTRILALNSKISKNTRQNSIKTTSKLKFMIHSLDVSVMKQSIWATLTNVFHKSLNLIKNSSKQR